MASRQFRRESLRGQVEHRLDDGAHGIDQFMNRDAHVDRRQVVKFGDAGFPHTAYAPRVAATNVFERHRELDQTLVEAFTLAGHLTPDVLPDLVGLEKIVFVEEYDAVVEDCRLVVGMAARVDRVIILGGAGGVGGVGGVGVGS